MSSMVVACAGCGKRYKGDPGARKYKCGQCGNAYTFPATLRTPAAGKVLCSCCWAETPSHPDLSHCPQCQQRITLIYGGKATLAASGATASSARRPERIPMRRPRSWR